jgi:WD40 repeat protein
MKSTKMGQMPPLSGTIGLYTYLNSWYILSPKAICVIRHDTSGGTTLEQFVSHEPAKCRPRPGKYTFLLIGLLFFILAGVLGALFLPRLLLSHAVMHPPLLNTSPTLQGAFSPYWLNKHAVFLESSSGPSYLWNLSTNTLTKKTRLSCVPATFESMYTGLYDICTSDDGTIQANSILRGVQTVYYNDHHTIWRQLTLSSDKTKFAALSDQEVFQIWDLQTGMIQLTLHLPRSAEPPLITWSPDEQKLAVDYHTQSLQIWDLARHHLLYHLTGPGLTDKGGEFSWSSDSVHLGYADDDPADLKPLVDIWDMNTGALSMTDQLSNVIGLGQFRLLAGGQSFFVRTDNSLGGQFELVSTVTHRVLLGQSPSDRPVSLQVSPDTNLLELSRGEIKGGNTTTIEIDDAATGQKVASYPGLADAEHVGGRTIPLGVFLGDWSPDSQSLASVGPDGRLHVWDAHTGQERASYTQAGEPSAITRLDTSMIAWSSDESMIALMTLTKVYIPGSSQEIAYVVSAP